MLEGEEWGKRVVVGGDRAPDKVCERQEMAGEEEQVTTQVCLYSTRTCNIITPSVS